MKSMRFSESGFSLAEVLIASVLITVVAAGTMASLIASAKMTHDVNASTMAEAGGQASQILETMRSRVAADDTFFADHAGMDNWTYASLGQPNQGPNGNYPGGSPLSTLNQDAMRKYRVFQQDCDGDGKTGDCYSVAVEQCWDGSTWCTPGN